MICDSHEPRLEIVVLNGCSEPLLEKYGAPDNLVVLVPCKVIDLYTLSYINVHHFLKSGDDDGSCFVADIAYYGVYCRYRFYLLYRYNRYADL